MGSRFPRGLHPRDIYRGAGDGDITRGRIVEVAGQRIRSRDCASSRHVRRQADEVRDKQHVSLKPGNRNRSRSHSDGQGRGRRDGNSQASETWGNGSARSRHVKKIPLPLLYRIVEVLPCHAVQ